MKCPALIPSLCIACIASAPLGADPAPDAPRSAFPGVVDVVYSSWEAGKPGGSLTVPQYGTPVSFNPVTASDAFSKDVLRLVFETVVDIDPLTLQWVPALAEKWQIAPDGLSAVFTMRRGLKWSDGKDLSAEDVVFTVNDIILAGGTDGTGGYPVKTEYRDGFRVGGAMARVEPIDRYSFRLVLPEPSAGLLELMRIAPVPRHVFEPLVKEKGLEAVNSFWAAENTSVYRLVGSGPFLIDQYLPGLKVVLKRNPAYWGKDSGGRALPYLDKVSFLNVENGREADRRFQSGDIDCLAVQRSDMADLLSEKAGGEFGLYNGGPSTASNFLALNLNPAGLKDPVKLAWFSDARFRRALAHLVDRQAIVKAAWNGYGFPQDSLIPSFSPYWWPGSRDLVPAFDPDAARGLLDAMDLKDRNGDGIREDVRGNRVSFQLLTNSGNTAREAIGRLICQEAKTAGIEIKMQSGEFRVLSDLLRNTFAWEGVLLGFTGSADPMAGSNVYPSRGALHLIEPGQSTPRRDWEKEVDTWWDFANRTLDEGKRREGFRQVQRIWLEELPWIFTANEAVLYAFRNKIGNVKPRPALGGIPAILPRLYVK